jgi:hypothetical protein
MLASGYEGPFDACPKVRNSAALTDIPDNR